MAEDLRHQIRAITMGLEVISPVILPLIQQPELLIEDPGKAEEELSKLKKALKKFNKEVKQFIERAEDELVLQE